MSDQGMRDRLKEVSEELLTKRGYHAVTFREIAEVVSTTRANMHYHFTNKDTLIEEVLADYAEGTLKFHRTVWTNPETTLRQKTYAILDFLHKRFQRFNTDKTETNPWSLTTRLRSDWEALSPKMQEILRDLHREFESLVRIGVSISVRSGELQPNAPEESICIQFTNNILYAASFTRDFQSFERLVDLWEATLSTTEKAYGAQITSRTGMVAHRDQPKAKGTGSQTGDAPQ